MILRSFRYWNWKFGSKFVPFGSWDKFGEWKFEKLKMTTTEKRSCWVFMTVENDKRKLKTTQVPRSSVVEVGVSPTQNFGSRMTFRNQNYNRAIRCLAGRPKIFIRHWPKQNSWRRPKTRSSQSENFDAKFLARSLQAHSSPPRPPQIKILQGVETEYFNCTITNFESVGKFGGQTKAEF